MALAALPALGVGVMWFPGLAALYADLDAELDFYEFEPAVTARRASAVPWLSGPVPPGARPPVGKPTLVHSVTCALGGSQPPDPVEAAAVGEVARRVRSPWVSEHLSVDRLVGPDGTVTDAGFLLPPEQTVTSALRSAAHVRRFRDAVSRPVAFETGVNYLQPRAGDMADAEFFALVAEEADCFILCDLHNLWCNERNGRQPVLDVVASLPPERICELHLAGGQVRDGYHLDAHSGTVDDALFDLAIEVAMQLPALKAVTFELMPDYAIVDHIGVDRMRAQLAQLRRIWDARGSGLAPPRSPALRIVAGVASGDESNWENEWIQALRADAVMPPTGSTDPTGVMVSGAAVVSTTDDRTSIAADPGAQVYRDLIETMRLGNIVTALPLTYRLMAHVLGLDATDRVCQRYLAARPPRPWAYEEAAEFVDFILAETTTPHLASVAQFEIAAQRATLTGEPVSVAFECDPTDLLTALSRGEAPGETRPGSYIVKVEP